MDEVPMGIVFTYLIYRLKPSWLLIMRPAVGIRNGQKAYT
jgi:hypothetical protein